MSLTKEYLQELFEYKEGNLYWKLDKGQAKAGQVAGETPDDLGNRKVMIDGISYRLHRLIWMYHNGITTKNVIFQDSDRSNTKIENLSVMDTHEVLVRRKKFKNSSSQYKGVYFNKISKRWIAQVKHQKITVYAGSYPSEELAHAAWLKKAAELRNLQSTERETGNA